MFLQENIIILWIQWYFLETPKGILKGWKNFLLFNLNFFSIPLLLKTLFSHWKKYYWTRQRGFSFGDYFNVLLSNLMSRFLGALIRITLIITGIILELVILIGGLIILIGWIVLPVLLIAGLIFGLLFIIP